MDYRDIILGSIGSALVAIAGWMAPAIQRSISSLPSMFEAQKDIAASLSVLSRVCATMMAQTPHSRTILLLIEDNAIDAHQFQSVCWEMLKETQHTLVISPTLESSYRYLPFTRVAVVDVMLPDANETHVKRYVREMSPTMPVIVWAASDYTNADFPGAYAVIRKADSMDKLTAVIKDALNEPRRS